MVKGEENIEEQILVSAFKIFVEKGYERSKMQEIANEAGISRTVLNYYFRSKDLLYQKIAKTILRQALPNVLKVLNSDLEFEKKIGDFVESYIEFSLKNPFMPLFIINELNNLGAEFVEKLLDGSKPNIQPFLEQIEHEIDKGNIIEINPIQLFMHIISLCTFPILGKPMIMLITNTDQDKFHDLIKERKIEVRRMILKGIKP